MTEDLSVKTLISIGLDEATAKRATAALAEMQRGFDTAKKHAEDLKRKYSEMAEQGEKLRNLGALAAGAGAALLAGPLALAQEYAAKFKGLEKQANDYAAAQQRSTQANLSLGRATATALVPTMNKVAELQEKLAAFVTAHPDLVSGVLQGGTALVAGGTALAAIGQAQATYANLNKVFQGGGIAGGALQAVTALGALAVGAKAGELAVKALGQVTDDQRLKQFDLSDALKTGRQLISLAILGIVTGIEKATEVLGGFAFDVTKITERIDNFLHGKGLVTNDEATINQQNDNIRKKYQDQRESIAMLTDPKSSFYLKPGSKEETSFLDDVYKETGKRFKSVQDLQAFLNGEVNQDEAAARANVGKSDRDKFIGGITGGFEAVKQDLAKKLTDFSDTGTLGSGVDKFIARLTGGGEPTTPAATSLANNPDAIRAFIERNKAQAKATQDELKAEADAKKSFAEANAKADREYQDQQTKINADFAREDAKASADFRANELKEDERVGRERARKQRDINDQLFDLAAARDVAGFVAAQKAGKKELDQMAEDAAIAKKERAADFAKQRQEARQARDQQLADLKTTHDREQDERRRAYDEQIAQLRNNLAIQRRTIDEGFADQIASLAGNIAGLGDVQQQIFAAQGKAFAEFIQQQGPYLKSLLGTLYGVSGTTTPTYTPQPYTSSFSSTSQLNSLYKSQMSNYQIPHFKTGTGLRGLPYTGLFHGEAGEIVLNPAQSDATRQGGGAGGITVNINNVVGDVAAKSYVDSMAKETVRGVKQAMAEAFGG